VKSANPTSYEEAPVPERTDWLRAVLDDVDTYVRRRDLHGYDPYDALLSPLFTVPLLRSNRHARLAAQQLLKRLPLNVRPLLGIRAHLSAVTCARMLEGYVHLAAVRSDGRDYYDDEIALCLRRIGELRSRGYSGDCWGYEFDWEARHAASPIPAGTPNLVATGIVANSLFEAHRLVGIPSALDSCASAAEFVLRDLERTAGPGDSFCWGYFPTDRQQVLNATMKGARLCAQVAASIGDTSLRDTAQRTVQFVVAHQRPDGAWPYAVGDSRSWVDNFHTGYLLDCLDAYERHTGDDSFAAAEERGWRYYRTNLLTDDCVPKCLDRRVHPIDATACAQTITTLCTFDDISTAERVARWSLANMCRRDGSFVYQRHAIFTNRIPYMRWSIAPMFCALSRLVHALEAPNVGW
jgi:hypothetical protein